MKTNLVLFAAFTAAFLSGASFSAAQVTIGGSDAPKAGTILDLNSTTKGGLALSNVNLTDLNTIPVGFPGINNSGDVTPEVKAKLTGALVYNINSNICLGVYVWNGNQWRKLDKDYQERASDPDNLAITAPVDVDEIVGGEAVTFVATKPGDAKFYHWYLNDVFLETTDTSTLVTTAIPAGTDHKMKVVLDDCLSLSSDEITFDAKFVYPASMSAAGNEWIRIFSADAFPYASTDEYEPDGLVAHYDGINNADMGDKYHDNAATVWKNLKGTTTLPDAEMCASQDCSATGPSTDLVWEVNSAHFGATNTASWFRINKESYVPEQYTLEVVYKTDEAYTVDERIIVTNFQLGGFGIITGSSFTAGHVGLQQWLDGGYKVSPKISYTVGGLLTLSGQLINNNTDGCKLAIYVNGVGHFNTISSSVATIGLPDDNTVWAIGANPQISSANAGFLINANIYSVRLYDRKLSLEEIQSNAALDQKRYLAPPTVTIGGDKQCTNVTVLSPRVITCLAPPSGGTTGKATIVVEKATGETLLTLTDEFEYY
ncbi:MAG: LamG domain-containing protein [Prevotellaceae bacterium]|jgi:hypothetical protein|nr:LamG domain-containing protein [Prevotellaceae bacterium]